MEIIWPEPIWRYNFEENSQALEEAIEPYLTAEAVSYTHLDVYKRQAEDIPNVPGVEVFEILKVYSIQKKKRFTKVHFDCLRASDNKLFYNLTLKIENVYTNYNDLIKMCIRDR